MFGAGYLDDRRVVSVVDKAIECGINFIDTADAYNDGHSERVVGMAVRSRRHDFVVGTKGFIPTGPGVNDKGLSRKHLVHAVESSLRRLGTDYIDLYQVHFWDPDTPLHETLRTLDGLVQQGKIRYLRAAPTSRRGSYMPRAVESLRQAVGLRALFESVHVVPRARSTDLGERGIGARWMLKTIQMCESVAGQGVIPYQLSHGRSDSITPDAVMSHGNRGRFPPRCDSQMAAFAPRSPMRSPPRIPSTR